MQKRCLWKFYTPNLQHGYRSRTGTDSRAVK